MQTDGPNATVTKIWLLGEESDHEVGYVDDEGTIYRLRWGQGVPIGRVDSRGYLFRSTQHDEREVGSFNEQGEIYSAGLFEGGELGWVDDENYVVQAGLIFGEEEVGRVDGPDAYAAGAALLLIFLPEEQEQTRRMNRT